jgi:bifunctional isochorismate lyase/aryl carrier protein
MSGLPRIASYSLPAETELPSPRVAWEFDRDTAALLIHDMQAYFLGAFAAGHLAEEVIANIATVRESCDEAGIPVFFTAQRGGQDPRDRGLQADFWGPGMRRDPEGEAIVEALAPRPGDIVLDKHRYSAFQRSPFEAMLRARGRTQLIITGVYAHIGCMVTAADAFQRDIRPFFVADSMAAFSREAHDLAIRHVSQCCGLVTTAARITEG